MLSDRADQAEAEAPGEGADAVIWDEVSRQTGEDSRLTWSFLAFLVLATQLAAIGIVTDSTIAIVGAMAVGPEFGPLAALAVALVRRQRRLGRDAALALGVGFPVAMGCRPGRLAVRSARAVSRGRWTAVQRLNSSTTRARIPSLSPCWPAPPACCR